jgi:hypothetical protein
VGAEFKKEGPRPIEVPGSGVGGGVETGWARGGKGRAQPPDMWVGLWVGSLPCSAVSLAISMA